MTANRTPARPAEADGEAIASPPIWWTVTQIVALAIHVPLSVFVGGVGVTIDLQEALLISIAVSLSGLVTYLLLKILFGPWRSLMATSALLIGFWHWSASEASGVVLRIAWVAVIVLAATRFAHSRRFRLAALTVAITLAATPLLLITIRDSDPDTRIAARFERFPGEPTAKPDIYFLLFDGYGNSDVLADIYGFDNEPFIADLERKGFSVSRSATADYTYTHASIPSVLNMEYLQDVGSNEDPPGLGHLTDAIAGDNRVVSWLKDLGYTYVHGETYDETNDCGPQVDVCLPSPFWDHTTEYLLGRTPIGGLLFPTNGSPATEFNVTRIEQMLEGDSWEVSSGEPVFVFIHLMLPHPPYFLDHNCETRLSDELGGPRSERGLPEEVAARRAAYVEQVECANRVAIRFIDRVDPDSMVILTGDHGPESFGQLTVDGSQWTDIEIYERSGVLAAIRGSAGCEPDMPNDHHLVNTFRIAFSCLTPTPIPLLPHIGVSER